MCAIVFFVFFSFSLLLYSILNFFLWGTPPSSSLLLLVLLPWQRRKANLLLSPPQKSRHTGPGLSDLLDWSMSRTSQGIRPGAWTLRARILELHKIISFYQTTL